MTIKTAINTLQKQYDSCPEENKHILMGINALKKQLSLPLWETYPYNLGVSIFGTECPEANEKSLGLSVHGIEKAMKTLTPREIEIVKLRFKDKLTYDQISEQCGIRADSTRQIISKSLRKLRHPSRLSIMRAYTYDDVVSAETKYNEILARNKELEKALMYYTINKLTPNELDDILSVIAIMNTNINDMGFSLRVYNTLARNNISTLNDITKVSMEQLVKFRNMGKSSIQEVLEKLDEYGLSLKE